MLEIGSFQHQLKLSDLIGVVLWQVLTKLAVYLYLRISQEGEVRTEELSYLWGLYVRRLSSVGLDRRLEVLEDMRAGLRKGFWRLYGFA